MTISTEEAKRVWNEADCLYEQNEVEQAIQTMAEEITVKLKGRNPLILTVMNGAVVLAGKLMMHLEFPLEHDYIHVTRYRGETSGDKLHWLVKPQSALAGRDILVVDDILDEGPTLKAIIQYCHEMGAEHVYSAVLVLKKHDRNVGVEADFVGVEAPDRYLFGYGMDYKEYLRNAAGIFAVKGM
ncbi:MAG: hypoxanthine-guanine phosphoribosyltransferase [Gammaproteobacteria bacterium]|nr:hypoxanthine-guanine phosphoribosyltransferase [Gammaproteobacteria bacterium]